MPVYVTREQFEARVGVPEQEVEGEKLVTRHVLEQTRRNGDDLAAMRAELKGLAQEVGSINAKLTALVRNLPTIIAEALRKDRSERRKRT